MGNLRRRLMLVSLIMLCTMPQGFIQAAPRQADVDVDLSWIKDLPPLIMLVVLMTIALIFVLRYLDNRQKVAVPTPEGGSKNVHVNEYVGTILEKVLDFMQDAKAKDRVFFEGITEGLKVSNGAVVQALDALKEALIQGNGNQITSMMEVRDEFRDGVQQMQNHRGQLITGLSELQTRVGSVQAEGAKMDKGLDDLLTETRKLAIAIQGVLDRIARVETVANVNTKLTQELKDDVDELRELMDHFASLMRDLTEAVRQAEIKATLPLPLIPQGPTALEPDKKEEISDGKPST